MSTRQGPVELVERGAWRVVGSLRRSDRLWQLVDATGIVCFVGPNGSGKSLAAVHSALRTLQGVPWACDELAHHHNHDAKRHWQTCAVCTRHPRGRVGLCETACEILDVVGAGQREVYSTVPLLGADGNPHPLFRPLVDFRQLVTIEHADVLFDEVAGIADTSDSNSIPVQVTNWLHQLRKRDVRLRVTTPAYARCAKPVRQVCQVVVDARAFMPEAAVSGRLWRPRRAMLYTAFDSFEFDDFVAGTGKRVKPLAGAAFWRPGSAASHAYDSLGAVLALGHVTDGGMCAVCGGSRSRPKCACGHDYDDLPFEQLVVEEKISAAGVRTRSARLRDSSDPDPAPPPVVQGPAPDPEDTAPPSAARGRHRQPVPTDLH